MSHSIARRIGSDVAGRSPSYLARQMYDIQAGTRHGEWAELMKPVVAKLTNDELFHIDRRLFTFVEGDRRKYRYPVHYQDIAEMPEKDKIEREVRQNRDEKLKLIVGLLSFEDLWRGLQVPAVFCLLTAIEGYLVTPLILSWTVREPVIWSRQKLSGLRRSIG